MNYRKLEEIVKKHGLTIDLERLVTGANHIGFFQFEIVGPAEALAAARVEIRDAWTVRPEFVQLRNSDIDGAPYLLVDSFYDDTRPDAGPYIQTAGRMNRTAKT